MPVGAWLILLVAFTVATPGRAIELRQTPFEMELAQMRQEYSFFLDNNGFDGGGQFDTTGKSESPVAWKPKSPVKAFVLSLAVPGVGQYYYGSRTKPIVFLGAEVAAWVLHFKWDNKGDRVTREFESFADAHWSEADYVQYLQIAYGISDDENAPPSAKEVSHHLPDTKTQQYYEMIGKYNQFSWGWEDAYFVTPDSVIHDPIGPVVGLDAPVSLMRNLYEEMRLDANNNYRRANAMIAVSLANHLISAFEAYLVTKAHNSATANKAGEFGRLRVRASMRSYASAYDTPFLNVRWRF